VYPENKSYDEIVKIIYDEISKKLWFSRYAFHFLYHFMPVWGCK
jgi:hypothetical protein